MKSLYFFLFLALNIAFGYSLEPPKYSGSNKYPQSIFYSKIKNQRVNGPVNAHLISEQIISTKPGYN